MDSMKDGKPETFSSSPAAVDYETLVNLSHDTIIQVGQIGEAVFISSAAERLFGWNRDRIAENLRDVLYMGAQSPDVETLQRILTGSASAGSSVPVTEVQVRSADASLKWTEITAHPLPAASAGFALYIRDISKRKELEALLEAANQTDPLTGLYNRRAFEDNLKREWAIAMREKSHTTLIKVSLDRFDAMTEAQGQAAADECLTKVAKTLKETARRPADITARTAGSEFALLLPRTHEMGAETISAYIHLAIQDLAIPNEANSSGDGMLTASVGAACAIAEKSGISETADFLLDAAENCVFQARQEGGNRVKSIVNHLGQ